MPLSIRRFCGGPLETNAYLIADTSSGDAIVVDAPPGITGEIVAAKDAVGATVHQIVVTHGHWDHIHDLHSLSHSLDTPIVGHPDLRERIEQPAAGVGPEPMTPVQMSGTLNEGDDVSVGGHVFTVMHMPGHDTAHIILYSEDDGLIFGGDVLFPGGHGRTDVPGSDQETMNRTLRRLLDLPGGVRVLPGHGDEVTLADEHLWIRLIPEE